MPFAFRAIALVGLLFALVTVPAGAQSGAGADPAARSGGLDPDLLLNAVVKVRMQALADARSNATLGREREGTGIVIDDAGHIVTIGYLVIEPDAIEVTTAFGRTVPARLVAFDHATGFGILKAQASLEVRPLPLGESATLAERDPVMVLPHGGQAAATVARVMSTRAFTGSWEYMLDTAIFTSPPTMSWAGAALVSRDGRLVGVGSLLLRDTLGPGRVSPGNMFVPIDALKAILPALLARGKRDGPPRPWVGMATDEFDGRLRVSRVSPDGPAQLAGIREGDVVVGIDGAEVKTLADLYRRLWSAGPAGVDIALRILRGAEPRDIRVKSIDRVEYFREKPPT